ncbi:hypothetical protein [Brevibacterium pigmentatum]|uniref:hypothetical protein n=1 Tax=Brevibacterium pigmentatum TaxID=1496080 RepID=UPI00142384D0|nr:hypothetical protein [Brevibacterium pigmentatum]
MKPQTGFLLITTAVVVLGLASLTLIGAMQYQTDRNNHRGTFVTNDHVTNFPWSLLPEDKQ